MDEPSLRNSRLAIAGGLLAAIALAGGGFLLGRTTLPRPQPEVSTPVPVPVVTPSPVEVAGALTRADILGIGARAADAMASGLADSSGASTIAGRRFEIVLPFGCEGSAAGAEAGPLHWTYDAGQQTLRIHVAPTRWGAGDWDALTLPDGTAPGLQGFWVNYPWMSAESCPQAQPGPDDEALPTDDPTPETQPATATEQTLAIAEVLPGGLDQPRRGDRPYEIVKRMAPERFDPKQGFRLRLRGRIERLPNGESVKCAQPGGVEQRPACVVAMSLNEVRIENPLNGEVLGTWATPLEDRTAP